MEQLTIALAGNPNCGKTTLFNALTGSRQRVGNWPGVTVERIEGVFRHDHVLYHMVDLPGIYSFSARSPDEAVARRYILDERPAVVVSILDAANLERNLYLTAQLLEMKVPVVVALNMMDVARQRGLRIDTEHLARHLDCPVVPVIASRGEGLDELRDAIATASRDGHVPATHPLYDQEFEEGVQIIRTHTDALADRRGVHGRWLAVRLLDDDAMARDILAEADDGAERTALVSRERHRIERHVGEGIDVVVADGRYGFIHGLVRDVVRCEQPLKRSVTHVIDHIVLNRVLGIPIFLLVMYVIFSLTITLAGPFIDCLDGLCGALFVDGFAVVLRGGGLDEGLVSLLADGIGGGLQTVATFIPPIFLIFLCLSILEDSGYMARAAFVMDRLLRGIGLPGKAFLPLLVGFGCNVPGIMAARTLENRRDRVMTILINPLMSCGARLPVYTVFAVAFFPAHRGLVVFSLYLVGMVLAVLTGLLLKHTLLRGEAGMFVMELPPYHVPTVGGVLHHTWNNLKGFILRAGKVILVTVLLLSALNTVGFSRDGGLTTAEAEREDSLLSAAGKGVTPVLGPMGIRDENWPATVGLFTGVFAKEAIIGSLSSLYLQEQKAVPQGGAEGEVFELWPAVRESLLAVPRGLREIWQGADEGEGEAAALASAPKGRGGPMGEMARRFGSRAAVYAYLLFVLIYCPCIAAVAAIYRETSWRWAVFSVGYLTLLAWLVATAVYQAVTSAAHPVSSALWLAICVVVAAGLAGAMRWLGRTAESA
ncbi:MAG: Fe(2+) transporter permease subunit FeoB [Planctomycetes bacterium]|jgi:ferrous iron transport protein B|nr:Fe(2+) transporter permease subunit FeoB [Phycisphaerae bacterium]NBB95015.1 Fe(2+) transporter permease subunit FeoB [Planctomycetota bacterium]